ncbi:MAG: hypothetical protein Hyperionvirus14_28 [Hyperionvirus sp.]|uniref:Uncharacterized protein n=1 Tax=Hyperionvirus sp. TaxID=2487770 RepID=A0A3G5AEZ4_9VIRU|nr:MAG: hypothetical protein Hyperionvirus14_28 [Hyperionvirus sp.]
MDYYNYITAKKTLDGDDIQPLYEHVLREREKNPGYDVNRDFSDVVISFLIKGRSRSHLVGIVVKGKGGHKLDDFMAFVGLLLGNYAESELFAKVMMLFGIVRCFDHVQGQNSVRFFKFLYEKLNGVKASYKVRGEYVALERLVVVVPKVVKEEVVINDDPLVQQFEIMAKTSRFEDLHKFLLENPGLTPSTRTLNNIYPNGAVSWASAEALYKIFLKRNFKTDISNLLRLEHGPLYNVICLTLVVTEDPNKLKSILLTNQTCFQTFLTHGTMIDLELFHEILVNIRPISSAGLMNLYKRLKVPANEQTLRLLCYFDCAELIDCICGEGVKPDYECLYNSCCEGFWKKNIRKLYNYKFFVDEKCFFNVGNLYVKKILGGKRFDEDVKFLAEYGFLPGLKHVRWGLERGFVIRGLENYGIAYDDELYRVCFELDNFPLEYVEKMGVGVVVVNFRNMFRTGSEGGVRTYLRENTEVVVDEYCFRNALRNRNNLMELMIECGYNPSLREIVGIKDEEKRVMVFERLFGGKKRLLEKN